MRKTRRGRPALVIAAIVLGAGTAHVATRAYTLYVDTGDVIVHGPATFESSARSESLSANPVLNNERDSLTITVVKQHSSAPQSGPSTDN